MHEWLASVAETYDLHTTHLLCTCLYCDLTGAAAVEAEAEVAGDDCLCRGGGLSHVPDAPSVSQREISPGSLSCLEVCHPGDGEGACPRQQVTAEGHRSEYPAVCSLRVSASFDLEAGGPLVEGPALRIRGVPDD